MSPATWLTSPRLDVRPDPAGRADAALELERVLPVGPESWQDRAEPTARRSRALLLRRVDYRPVVLCSAGAGRRGGWLRLHGYPGQYLLSGRRVQLLPP